MNGYVEFRLYDDELNHVARKIVALESIKKLMWERNQIAGTIALEAVNGYGLFAASFKDFSAMFDNLVTHYKAGYLGELTSLDSTLGMGSDYISVPHKTVIDGETIWTEK